MQGVSIYIAGEGLTIQKQTLNIREDSNSFTTAFKIAHSNNPFLIVKNEVSDRLLKANAIQDIDRNRIVDCTVQQGNIIYSGRLTVIDVFENTIKCDVAHYTDIFNLLQEDIKQYMPVVSVTGATTPPPYIEESPDDINDDPWETFATANKYNSWPTKDFCLPMLEYRDQFGTNLQEGDEWFYYSGFINAYVPSSGLLFRNFFTDADYDQDPGTPLERRFFNRNVVTPCVFILAPLQRALENAGYKLNGAFTTAPEVRATMLIPETNQMTKIVPVVPPQSYTYTGQAFLASDFYVSVFGTSFVLENRSIRITQAIVDIGTLKVKIDVDASNTPYTTDEIWCSIHFEGGGEVAEHKDEISTDVQGFIRGEFTYQITPEEVGRNVIVRYIHLSTTPVIPISSTVEISTSAFDKSVYKIHPTIELGRFVPDWTVAKYITALKNWKNLKVDIDAVSKTVTLNYNEAFLTDSTDPIVLENFKTRKFTPLPKDGFLLSYKGDNPEQLHITKTGVTDIDQVNDQTQEVIFEFKKTPHNSTTSNLSQDFLKSTGWPIAFYNQSMGAAYTAQSIEGKTHSIAGSGGLYRDHFQTWLKFRLNSSQVSPVLPATETFLQDIRDTGKVYFNNQLYIVSSIRSKQKDTFYEVTLEVESVNF